MGYVSKIKKYVKKGTKAVGKRYGISYGRRGLRMSKSSLSRIDRDVQMIKSRLNVEKKFIEGTITDGLVAQCNVLAPGYFTSTLTPLISQGDTENQRNGSSVKLTGLHLQLQLVGQTNTVTRRRFKACIVSSTESSVTNVINDLWDANPLTGFRDYYSNLNYSNQKRAHKIERTVYFSTGNSGADAQAGAPWAPKCVKKISHKFDALTRFEGTSNQPKDMNYFLIIFCDTGNSGSSTSGNSGVMIPELFTGMNLQEYFRWWYVDN